MADSRRELLARMREILSRLDPDVIERARLAAFGKVPYDRGAAREAVGSFLDGRDDDGAFRRKLEEALRAEGVDLDALPIRSAPPLIDPPDAGPKRSKWKRIGRII